MKSAGIRVASIVIRYACLAALAGLPLGLLEAMQVSRGFPGLLKPSVGPVIWFLAPLFDAAAAGFLGLAVGLANAMGQQSGTARRIAQAARNRWIALGAIAIFLSFVSAVWALILGSNHFHILMKMAAIFLAILGACLLGGRLRTRTVVLSLAGIFVFLLAGLAFNSLRPSVQVVAAAVGNQSPGSQRNIILISLDTVRTDHLSVYGYQRPTTPNLEKWARQGVVFENAIAPSSWTLASHASMFTGLLPHQHGADWSQPMDTSRWTLSEVLRSQGYDTAGFTSNLWYGEGGWGMDQGFEWYDDDSASIRHNLRALLVGGRVFEPVYYHALRPDYFDRRNASQINRDVFRWLESRSRGPYFLFINYFDAHDPYLAPPHFAHRFGEAPPGLIERTRPAFEGSSAAVSPQDQASLQDGYDNCLAALDDALGGLLTSLSHRSGWKDTVVIITSDHGESFGEHGTLSHGLDLYREVLHVPLIIFGPKVPAGLRIENLVSSQDLFSTVLQFAGSGDAIVRRSALQRFWTAAFRPEEVDGLVVSELLPKFRTAGLLPTISLTTSEWQYIRNSRGQEELYHWTNDQTEQANRVSSPDCQQVLAGLRARLIAAVRESRRPWKRPQYLSALGLEGAEIAAGSPDAVPGLATLRLTLHIGDVQDQFPPKLATASRRPQPSDEDLLRSLPYH